MAGNAHLTLVAMVPVRPAMLFILNFVNISPKSPTQTTSLDLAQKTTSRGTVGMTGKLCDRE